jgi:3-deoxy-7-phosphoheptulonate synthase
MSEQGSPYRLASRQWKREGTQISVKGIEIGGDSLFVIAGPCAVESEEQLDTVASFVSSHGVPFLRGGAYKPRTSPYSFQGLKKEGLRLLQQASIKYGLGVITEVMDLALLDEVYPYTDIIQVGSRNMKNYHFLKELGKVDKPILLKRGMDATMEEWLLAAEYLLVGGNEQVILCERGIRTFDDSTRNTMDIASIALAKELSHLPVIADPSQGTGSSKLIKPLSQAAIVANADGLMIEVHHNPKEALSDGPQSVNFKQFEEMIPMINATAKLMGKKSPLVSKKKEKVLNF